MWDDAKAAERARRDARADGRARAARGGASRWVARQPAFAFREVVVHDAARARERARTSRRSIRDELAGTFFTLDLERARGALARVPWVRDVALRRQWPQPARGRRSRSTRRSRAGTTARS